MARILSEYSSAFFAVIGIFSKLKAPLVVSTCMSSAFGRGDPIGEGMSLGERALSGVTERELIGDEGVEANEKALKIRDAIEIVLGDEGEAAELTVWVPPLDTMDPSLRGLGVCSGEDEGSLGPMEPVIIKSLLFNLSLKQISNYMK